MRPTSEYSVTFQAARREDGIADRFPLLARPHGPRASPQRVDRGRAGVGVYPDHGRGVQLYGARVMAEQKSAAAANAERIEAIIAERHCITISPLDRRDLARKIVEAFWQLQGSLQQSSERDGTARNSAKPLPWA